MFLTCHRLPLLLAVALLAWLPGGVASAQVSALISPGPLSRAHTRLEGLGNCAKCHEPGRQVTASRCLACHRPIADRIAARRGVHRNVTGDCVGCHSEHNGVDAELRPFDAQRFDHAAETGFALDGRHAPLAAACARCHRGRSFLQARSDCASCHADPHKGSLGAACTACHSTSAAFADARRGFDHAKTRFPLNGAHAAVACARCHVNKQFAGLRFGTCADCHKSPHRLALARDCTSCHDVASWRTQKMDHARTQFPLRGRHADLACSSCHRRSAVQVRLQFGRCADCHTDVHRGQFKEDCAACHRETGFRAVPFDHGARTRFALTGKHAGLPCSRCHPNAVTVASGAGGQAAPGSTRTASQPPVGRPAAAVVFAGASSACSSCHADPHRGETAADCSVCHSTSDFRVSAYKHDPKLAPFFVGQHQSASCSDCHGRLTPRPLRPATPAGAGAASSPRATGVAAVASWRFRAIGTSCASCHTDPHQQQLGSACETCHAIDDTRFSASRFSHAKTRFPLTGRHKLVDCARCHQPSAPSARQPALAPAAMSQAAAPPPPGSRPLVFKAAGNDCRSCHADVHLGQLGSQCQRCHSPESFGVATFKHEGKGLAGFFVGTHATLACRACHKPEQARFPAGAGTATRYVGSGTACASCHASEDAHRGALGRGCETCHEPAGWKSASRAFHKAGLFPLEGRHLTTPCDSCHVKGVMKGTPTTCFDCHWNRRQDDRYHTALGTQCEQCHRPTSWTAVQFNHAASTGFQLNLAHQVLRCDNCHRDGRFAGTSSSCVACHQAAYNATSQPNHAAAGFPTTCDMCHRASQASWRDARFDHQAYFPLVGVHASQTCASCHGKGTYAGTPRDCLGCHQADYQRTQNPNHAAAGFPTACETCHSASAGSWSGGSFNHSTFPLVGAHATQACATCHTNGRYQGTPRDCIGCHQADYQRAQNPNHAAAGFPTSCEQCHSASSSSWSASFDHNRFFPLLGRHAQQPCSACHRGNVYRGTASDCYACHQAQYQATRDPNHAAAGFPTACQPCHKASDSSWGQGSFNHTWFPISSGKHAGHPCSACHTSSNNFAVFTCTTCHGRSETDSHHREVSGYRYDSAACYACHPTGRGD